MGSGLPGIAGILLIVAAGGGFKQMLVDAGVGGVIADWAQGSGISTLLLGWLVAVGVRLATGSATVATITAAGIVSGIAADLPTNEVSLLVLAIGCGSLFFSHVNDAGFWLVKEYFGLTVGQTIKSWSVMETAISVVGRPLGGQRATDIHPAALAEEQNASALLHRGVRFNRPAHVHQAVEHVLRRARGHQHGLATRRVDAAGIRDEAGHWFAVEFAKFTGVNIAQGEVAISASP